MFLRRATYLPAILSRRRARRTHAQRARVGDVPHYTAPGGKPGYYPPMKGNRPELLFDLYKPFDIFTEQMEEEKARGRLVEVNNGRAAMLGLMAVLSESKGLVVPPLDYIDGFPKYSGDIMLPFEGQFHVNEALGAWTEAVLAPATRGKMCSSASEKEVVINF